MAGSPRPPSAPFLVSYGSESLLLDRDMDRVRAWRNRTYTRYDGHGMEDHEIVDLCETQRSEPQTIVIDNAQKVKGNKALKAYVGSKSVSDLSVILVGIVRSDKLPELWGTVAEKGKLYERKKLKTWDNGKDYVKWCQAEADRLKVRFDKDIDQLFYNYVGADLYRLSNELKKLARLVGPGGKITRESVALVTSPSPQADPFMVAEAAMAKQPKKAMNALSVLIKNEGDGVCVPVTAALMKQVERSLVIRRMHDQGVDEDEIALAVGMKVWPLRNFALPVAKLHDVRKLSLYMRRLCKLDADVKGPARSKRTLVELTVLAISGQA